MSGGGFFPESDSQTLNSPSKTRSSNPQGIRALTIKQVHESETNSDARLVVDGQEVHQFSVVACIRAIKEMNTGLDYTIEDGTGSISARCWPNQTVESVKDGDWVHVYGTFKAHGNSKSITIAAMRKIVDFNEVTYHFLEAITAHKIASDPSFLKGNVSNASKQSKLATSFSVSDNNGLTPIQQQVINYYRTSPQNEAEGVNINDAVRALRDRYSENDIRQSVNQLLDEGMLYMTIDNNHARCLTG